MYAFGSKMVQDFPKMAQGGPNRDGSKMVQDFPKMALRWSKTSLNGAKTAPREPKTASRWLEMVPTRPQD